MGMYRDCKQQESGKHSQNSQLKFSVCRRSVMCLTAANVLLRSGFTNRLRPRFEAVNDTQNQHCLTKETMVVSK